MGEKMDSEREAFEKWAADQGHYDLSWDGEFYVQDSTVYAWAGWKARSHITQPAQAVDDDTLLEVARRKAHLLAREAEVERLQNIADGNAELYQHELLRTEKAEALLRECSGNIHHPGAGKLEARITAYLSENSREV